MTSSSSITAAVANSFVALGTRSPCGRRWPPHGLKDPKQAWLRQTAVPLVQPKDQLLVAKQVQVRQPSAVDENGNENGKEMSPAQARAVSQTGACWMPSHPHTQRRCLYVPRGGKGTQVAVWSQAHRLQPPRSPCKGKRAHCKHMDNYLPKWDGQGPALEKLKDAHSTIGDAFKAYLDLAANESAYAS